LPVPPEQPPIGDGRVGERVGKRDPLWPVHRRFRAPRPRGDARRHGPWLRMAGPPDPQWWIPYLWGPTWLHSSLEWYTEHGYAETIKVLPPIGDHPIPDAQHLVLQLLSLIAAITMTIAYLRTRRRAGRPSAERPPPAYGDDGQTPRFHLDTRMAPARASASGGGAIGAPRGDARSFRC
jgi:hypothetical protein